MGGGAKSGVVELGGWLALAALGFYFSLAFDREIEFYRFGAATWPRVILGLIVIAALGQWWTSRGGDARDESEAGLIATAAEQGPGYMLRLAVTFGLPLAYAALWDRTGFYITTPIFLVAYLYMTGERRILWLLGVPVVISGGLTIIFTRFLYVGLPVGYWQPFYAVSNWIVTLIRG